MVEVGIYTPSEDISASRAQIQHSLGVVPDFVLVVADEFTATSDMTVRYIANSYCAKANLVASNKNANGYAAYQTNWNGRDTVWAAYENVDYTKFLKDTYFLVPYYSSGESLKAGVTYHYVVGTFA